MKNGLWLLVLLLTLACNQRSTPENLLSRDKMEDVLWDMMRADLFINNYMVIKDANLNKQQQGIEFYTQILKLHHVSQEQFRTSFEYYRSRPDEIKILMDSLSHRNDTAMMSKPTKTPAADSLPKSDTKPVPKTDTSRKTRIPRSKAE